MNKTPMQNLIRKIELMEMADAVIEPLTIVKKLATELLAEERGAICNAYKDGFVESIVSSDSRIVVKATTASDYFTQTYGGGDE